MRTHISLPEDLVAEIDALVGARKRSAFIEEAVRRKLVNERQKQVLAYLESLPPLVVPEDEKNLGWASMTGTEWQDKLRREELELEAKRRAERDYDEVTYDKPRPQTLRRIAEE